MKQETIIQYILDKDMHITILHICNVGGYYTIDDFFYPEMEKSIQFLKDNKLIVKTCFMSRDVYKTTNKGKDIFNLIDSFIEL